MNARRAVAAGVSVVLVVLAFVVRGAIDDDDSEASPTTTIATVDGTDPADGDTGTDATGTDSAGAVTTAPAEPVPTAAPAASSVVCITELESVCDAIAAAFPELDTRVEPAGATLDRLTALDDPATAPIWLTVDPYPAMVDAARRDAPPIGYTATPGAASRLALAVPNARPLAATLRTGCGDDAVWSCVGDNAGAPWIDLGGETAWGTVRPSLGDVPDSAVGLASFAAAVAGYTGIAAPTAFDWESDTSFIGWLRRLVRQSERAASTGGTPLRTMATRPSALDVAATSDFELAALGASGDRFELVYPQPDMWLHAVVAVPAGVAAPDDFVAISTDALTAAGWDAPGGATSPLPGAATMLALRALWEDQ